MGRLKLTFCCFLLLGLASLSLQSQSCRIISPFHHVCTILNDTVIVLSAKACTPKHVVSLTIMRTSFSAQAFFNHTETEGGRPKLKPIRIGNSKTGIILDLHPHPGMPDDIHVTVATVQLNINGTVVADHNVILDVVFHIYHKYCESLKHGDHLHNNETLNPGFQKQSHCNRSMRLGDFSTLCYKKTKVFLTIMNVCDIPYSVTVMALVPRDSVEIIKKYTAEDVPAIPIKAKGVLGGECGMKLEMFHSHMAGHEKQHVKLTYNCRDVRGTKMTLIDDSYYTYYGIVCDASPCTKIHPDVYECKETFIANETTTVNTTIRVDLDICSKKVIQARVAINVTGYSKQFIDSLERDRSITKVQNNAARHNFTLGGPSVIQRGYLPIDGGEISLHVVENSARNIFHVMLLRHYPSYYDAFPILQADFYLSKEKHCKRKHSSRMSVTLKIVIPIVCAVLVLLAVVLIVRWFKAWRYRNGADGLPYHIELGDDDFDMRT